MDIRTYTWVDTFKNLSIQTSTQTPTQTIVIGVIGGVIGIIFLSAIGFLGYKWHKKYKRQQEVLNMFKYFRIL